LEEGKAIAGGRKEEGIISKKTDQAVDSKQLKRDVPGNLAGKKNIQKSGLASGGDCPKANAEKR